MGLKQPQQPVFRFLLPHLDQVHDHDYAFVFNKVL